MTSTYCIENDLDVAIQGFYKQTKCRQPQKNKFTKGENIIKPQKNVHEIYVK